MRTNRSDRAGHDGTLRLAVGGPRSGEYGDLLPIRRPRAVPAQRVSETASMVSEYAQSDQFRGARIHLCNLAGLEIRDCEVNGLKIVDCYGSDVYLGGDFERLVV